MSTAAPNKMIDSNHARGCPLPHVDLMNKKGDPSKVVFNYFYSQIGIFLVGLVVLVGSTAAQFYIPYLIGQVIDQMKQRNMDEVSRLVLQGLAIVAVSAVCAMFRGAIFNTMSEEIAKHLRYDIFFFLLNKDVAFFDENKTGELLSRIATDTTVI
mmetsp:Transcript_12194/g.20551  ORF Transcript_12194/g.20551 Transcript_12194/m.20551 type:complete len:155 (+) Transcript_12194:80-544(+)